MTQEITGRKRRSKKMSWRRRRAGHVAHATRVTENGGGTCPDEGGNLFAQLVIIM